MRLGTSSPTTMERYDTMSVMTMGDATGATAESGAMPNDSTHAVSGSESVLDETVAEKKPTSVMATWMVARKFVESFARSSASAARRSPSSASCSSVARFAVVSAISLMEK